MKEIRFENRKSTETGLVVITTSKKDTQFHPNADSYKQILFAILQSHCSQNYKALLGNFPSVNKKPLVYGS
jgi:hypothetical protein